MSHFRASVVLFFVLYVVFAYVHSTPIPLMPPPTVETYYDNNNMSKKPEDFLKTSTLGVPNEASDGGGSSDGSGSETDHTSLKTENFINPKVTAPNKAAKEGTSTKDGHETIDYLSDDKRSQHKTEDVHATKPRVKPFDYGFTYMLLSLAIIFVVFAIGISFLRESRCCQSTEPNTPDVQPPFEILPESPVDREPFPSTSRGVYVPSKYDDTIVYRPIDDDDDDDEF